MMTIPAEWFNRIVNSHRFDRLFRYVAIGLITTFISFGIFWLLIREETIKPNPANIISVACAVIFAYTANKNFVFMSKCANFLELVKEFFRFILSRGFTMLVEIAGLFMLHNILLFGALTSKIIISAIVLLLNYLAFQFMVFRNTRINK